MKVLVADNVRTFQQLVSSLFENTGLQPVVASSGQECLAALEKEEFAFICLSMHMEGDNGIELCKTIRATPMNENTPIILLTADESVNLSNQAMAAGVTGIFNKAKDLDQLVAYIKRFTIQHQPIDGNILYVEDTRSLRLSTIEMLESKGLSVDDFSDAEAAWEAFKVKKYDLVITDILLAGQMNGLAFVNKIRRLNDPRGDVPILAVTGFDDISRRIELFHMGVNDYAIKPIVEEELLARIRYLIGSSRDLEQQVNLIRLLFDTCTDGLTVFDNEGQIERANNTFLEKSNVSYAHIIGKNIKHFIKDDENEVTSEDILKILEKEMSWNGKVNVTSVSGDIRPCFLKVECVKSSSSLTHQYIGIWSEVEKQYLVDV